jgi:ABC-type sugar transport system permease subunit
VLEAASLDGSGAWQRFRFIVVPYIRSILVVLLILQVIWDLRVFAQIYALQTVGGIRADTNTIGVYIYSVSMATGDLGSGGAISVMLVIVLLAISAYYIRTMLKEDDSMSARTRRATGRVLLKLAAVVVFVCSVFPVYWMVNTAFLPGSAVKSETPHFWPDQFTLQSFARGVGRRVRAGAVDLARRHVLTVAAALVFAFLAAIAVSRYRFRSRKSFIVAILVIQMILAEAMIISTFRVLDGWHLLNTVIGLSAVYIAMVLPSRSGPCAGSSTASPPTSRRRR